MDECTIKCGKRRTIAIEIRGSEVIAHVPETYNRSALVRRRTAEFIESKREWIERKLSEVRENACVRLPGFAGHETLYVFGKPLPVAAALKGRSVRFDGKTLYIPSFPSEEARQSALVRWYKKYALKVLSERLASISSVCGLTYKSFGLTSARRKWGSCSSEGAVLLNYRLIVLPERIVDYVIVHELCHTVALNHSAVFWGKVSSIMPDYAERRKELNCYRFVMNAI